MTIAVARLTPCFAAQIDGVDIARLLDEEKGQLPRAVHFAQINEKDGFFLTARQLDPALAWDKLMGKKVLVDLGGRDRAGRRPPATIV